MTEKLALQQKLPPINSSQRYKILPHNFPPEWGAWQNAEAAMLIITAMALLNTSVVHRNDVKCLLPLDYMARFNVAAAEEQIDVAIETLCGEGLVSVDMYGEIRLLPAIFQLITNSDISIANFSTEVQVAQIARTDVHETIVIES